jgi:hypothetical protein
VIARHQHLNVSLAADEVTPLAVAGGFVLWLLRLTLAPTSTLAGFRAWVLEECPVAPGRRAARPAPIAIATGSPGPRRGRGRGRGDTKSARFLARVTEHHGPLSAIPLDNVAKISAALAPQIDFNTGAARTVLRRAILAAHARRTSAIPATTSTGLTSCSPSYENESGSVKVYRSPPGQTPRVPRSLL